MIFRPNFSAEIGDRYRFLQNLYLSPISGSLFPILFAFAAVAGCRGEAHGPGVIEGKAIPAAVIDARTAAQQSAASAIAGQRAGATANAPSGATAAGRPGGSDRQILFGDLHVHTTYSADAFMMSLPLMQGEGVHPVADACDFARYCSALDFWSITDHAESLTPKRWRKTVDSIRRCQAVSGDSKAPDLISFLGWEWTQIGLTADEHYGHRNVILKHLENGKIPERPVAASAFSGQVMRDKLPWGVRYLLPTIDWKHRGRYLDFLDYWRQTREAEECPPGVHVKEVDGECMDFAKTPAELFEKLRQWDVESTVIPHGTSWGIYTPPGYFLDKSLRGSQNDDERQRLIEVFSGHGNSEEYRNWREAKVDTHGLLVCPEASADYEPCCWRAGEIIRSRCEDPESSECQTRVEDARRNYLAAGASGRLTVAGADVAAWGACGQCLDCFDPAFEYRPGGSVQYALALTDFTDPKRLRRFHFGFVASSDNHSAKPGTGYKEFRRQEMTESFGPRSEFWREQVRPLGEPEAESEAIDPRNNRFERFQLLDFERGSSFFYTGGLVAVHAERRDRDAVWDALERREVYGTSGERILLWFDLLRPKNGGVTRAGTGDSATATGDAVAVTGDAATATAPGDTVVSSGDTVVSMGDTVVSTGDTVVSSGDTFVSMGAKVDWAGPPRFRVRAVGSFEQQPGCPDFSAEGLDPERLQALCAGECFNPGDKRHPITRIEVVRIRPQVRPGEPIADLVEDPWKTLPCPAQGTGCVVEFEDTDYVAGKRDAIYYVRAIQQATPAVNAAGLRCTRDDKGACTDVNPCYGDWRTPYEDDCLAPNEERAWSSPIYLGWRAGAAASLSSSAR